MRDLLKLLAIALLLVVPTAWPQQPVQPPTIISGTPSDMCKIEKCSESAVRPVWAQAPSKPRGNKVVRFLIGPWKDWRFMVAMAPFAVGLALDGHSTALVQRRRPGAVELNPFLPPHPTPKQISLYVSVYFVGQTYAAWGIKQYAYDPENPKSKEPYLWVGGYSTGLGLVHGVWAARHNYNLVTCPSGFFKPPGLPGCVAR